MFKMKKEPTNSETISVRKLRQEMGDSQQQLATKLGIHWRTVADWERKGIIPSFETVVRMSKVMNVSLKTLAEAFNFDVTGIPDDNPTE